MRTPIAVLSALVLCLPVAALAADEPAPATAPGTGPATAPAAAPARRTDPPGLPPPVVRRSGSAPASAPASAPVAAPAAAPTTGSTTEPAPSSTLPPVMEFQPPAPAPAAPSAPAVPATGPAILDIVKNHNMADEAGTLWLRLDVRFRADGPAGSAYRVWIHFHDNATGQAIKTSRPSFGDLQGAMYVVTKPVQHGGGTVEYVAPLWVPYNAFPDPGSGKSIVVDATASLTLVAGDSETPLGSSATNFRVHGPETSAPR